MTEEKKRKKKKGEVKIGRLEEQEEGKRMRVDREEGSGGERKKKK